jgi:diguanylate cyclase (GGDEF)-like protein
MPENGTPDYATDDTRSLAALAEAFASTDVLERMAGTLAILLYQMECGPDGTFECTAFLGSGLEALVGPIPSHYSPEEAWDAAVHEDDRAAYEAASAGLKDGRPVEVEYRLVGYDGVTRWVSDRMHPRPGTDGPIVVDGIVVDISERRLAAEQLAEAQERLSYIAYHDSLTDLPNRTLFQEHLESALHRARDTGAALAVFFVDLDNFKLINDSFGHASGDELLCAVAARLKNCTRTSDTVARQGGDEFLILVPDVGAARSVPKGTSAQDSADEIAWKIRRVLQEPFVISGVEIYVTASVGISLFPLDAADRETLLKHADVAMYEAKGEGRDRHHLYAAAADGDALRQLSMAGRLRRAVEAGEGLVLHYQPLVNMKDTSIVGVEALIRWTDGERGLVQPNDFIPLAERTGLIGPMSDWVVEQACRQAAAWRADGLDLFVSVNLPASFWQPMAMRHVLGTIESFGLNADRLMIEITESAVMEERGGAMGPVLAEIHERGLKLAIDDFGTGHSSLGRLSQMHVTTLKIDRSFVSGLPDDPNAAVLVTSMIQLADSLGLYPLAEGIETEEQRQFVLERGCKLGQGFLFSRAVPAEEIPALYPEFAGRA